MEKKTLNVVLLVGLGAFLLLIVFVIWKYGALGLFEMLKKLALFGLLLGAIGLVVFLVIWLFQTKEIDMVAVHRDRIVAACRLNQTPYVQTLAMRSYGDDWAVRSLGKVVGTCAIRAQPKKTVHKEGREEVLTVAQKNYDNLFFIAFRPPGFINLLLGTVEVAGGTREDFTRFSADVIYLNGMTFAPEIYKMFFLSHHWEHRNLLDETITNNIYRYTMQENLKELATMMEDAIDASPRFKKEREQRNIQTLPVGSMQQGGEKK